jgi:hypothetical protein
VDNGFAGMRGKLDAAAAGQEQIAWLLSALIERENGPHDARERPVPLAASKH